MLTRMYTGSLLLEVCVPVFLRPVHLLRLLLFRLFVLLLLFLRFTWHESCAVFTCGSTMQPRNSEQATGFGSTNHTGSVLHSASSFVLNNCMRLSSYRFPVRSLRLKLIHVYIYIYISLHDPRPPDPLSSSPASCRPGELSHLQVDLPSWQEKVEISDLNMRSLHESHSSAGSLLMLSTSTMMPFRYLCEAWPSQAYS